MTARQSHIRIVDTDAPNPYVLDREFGMQVAWLCCRDRRFWEDVGQHIDPEKVPDPGIALIVKACRAVAKDTGSGPSAEPMVLQALRDMGGTITRDDRRGACEVLEDAQQYCDRHGNPQRDQMTRQLAEILKADMRIQISDRITEAAGKGKSLLGLAREIERVETIGQQGRIDVIAPGPGMREAVKSLRRGDRLSTMIPDLDLAMRGGFTRQSLTVYGALTGVGKSQTLTTVAFGGVMAGRRVVHVQAEMTAAQQAPRTLACFTNLTIDRIEDNPDDPEIDVRLDTLRHRAAYGAYLLIGVERGSTVLQVEDAVDRAIEGDPAFADGWDVMVLDYADRLNEPMPAREASSYRMFQILYERLISLAERRNGWVVTASPLKDLGGREVPDEAEDLSDSKWKGRTAQNIINLWPSKDDPEVINAIMVKGRDGGVGTRATGLVHGMACGRLLQSCGLPFEQPAGLSEDDGW